MINFTIKLFPLVILFLFSCGDDNQPTDPDSVFGDAPVNPDQILLVSLVNEIRTTGFQCGSTNMPAVQPISWSDLLESAAKKHSEYMNSIGDLRHDSADGSNAGNRIEAEGYNLVIGSWAENIAVGHATEESVFNAWKDSESHCKNMMKAEANEMGIGTSGAYWTMDFAAQQ